MNPETLRSLLYTEDPPDNLWAKIKERLPKYYTYMYLRQDGTPYYIGKGYGRRMFSKRHHVAVPECGRITRQYWASEQEALRMEQWWIKLFGRKDLGTGILRNLTDGGEQTPRNLSPEAKKRQVAGMLNWLGSPAHLQHIASLHTSQHQAQAGRKGGGRHSRAQKAHCRRIAHLGAAVAMRTGQAGTIAHIRWHVNKGIRKEGCKLCATI